MIGNQQQNIQAYRDGTGQKARKPQMLDADYVKIDERSKADLLRFAHKFSHYLRYYDEHNEVAGTWEGFLVENIVQYNNSTPAERQNLCDEWVERISNYVETGQDLTATEDQLLKLKSPHLVLFLTFLELLETVKEQLNGLTKKHLDFYYQELLGFTKKPAIPDLANIMIELDSAVDEHLIEAGTLLDAGKDADGIDRVYSIDEDTVFNRAQVAEIKSLYLDKEVRDVHKTRLANMNEPDMGFTAMMQLALGSPNPGDPLPTLPAAYADFEALAKELAKSEETVKPDALDYVNNALYLTQADFNTIILIRDRYFDPRDKISTNEWNAVYNILNIAFNDREIARRKDALKTVWHEEDIEARRFTTIFEAALGDPESGDRLPILEGNPFSLQLIDQYLVSSDPYAQSKVKEYIWTSMKMSVNSYLEIQPLTQKTALTDEELDQLTTLLERSERSKRNLTSVSPSIEVLNNIYQANDATTVKELRSVSALSTLNDWKTFGTKPTEIEDQKAQQAKLGFAVTSPLLELHEGKRTIDLIISFKDESYDLDTLDRILKQGADDPALAPFALSLSGEEDWINCDNYAVTAGNFMVESGKALGTTLKRNKEVLTAAANLFDPTQERSFVVHATAIYHIEKYLDAKKVQVTLAGNTTTEIPEGIYTPEQLFVDALRFTINLDAKNDPVLPMIAESPSNLLQTEYPVMRVMLRAVEMPNSNTISSFYKAFRDLAVYNIHLAVEVDELQDALIMNDVSTLSPKKPFAPFSGSPHKGISFYFTHRELSLKRLHELNFEFDWQSPPEDFAAHYATYLSVLKRTDDLKNEQYTFDLKLYDNRTTLTLAEDKTLFEAKATDKHTQVVQNIPNQIAAIDPSYSYSNQNEVEEHPTVYDWNRYFLLEYTGPDFMWKKYSNVVSWAGVEKPGDAGYIEVNEPYIPTLKTLKIGYKAKSVLTSKNSKNEGFFHIKPFGYCALDLSSDELPGILHTFNDQGTLYLGLADLKPAQNITILFQMAEGSGEAGMTIPTIEWSYLANNEWFSLESGNVIYDRSNGLQNTGIMKLEFPKEATTNNTLLTAGLHWIRAAACTNSSAIPNTIKIAAQAVPATFVDNNNSTAHYEQPLPPQTITGPLVPDAAVSKIIQPFSTQKGRTSEKDEYFYTRISERIRHKNRALTMWDYERLVLENFPHVYKVKCLSADHKSVNYEAGLIRVVTIPDLVQRMPFDPFQPKMANNQLKAIEDLMVQHMPAFASISVQNPRYMQVKIRFAVKLRDGYSEGFYLLKLHTALKKFLSPWAYEDGQDIVFGGKIYGNVIVNFIEEQPYVDYVAELKLFQSTDGIEFTDARILNGGENIVAAQEPDIILVSSKEHVIDVIDEEGFIVEEFRGIDYAKIELDFTVGADPSQIISNN